MSTVSRYGWRNLPLGSKLALLTSLLVIGLVVALTAMSTGREKTNFPQDLEQQARLLLDTLPLTMRDPLSLLEVDELQDIANVAARNEDVTRLIIYDAEGRILVDTLQDEPVFGQTPDPQGKMLVALASDEPHLEWESEQLMAGRSIDLGNQRIGAVAIGLSTAPLDQKIATLTAQSGLLALGTLAVGLILALFFAQQITTPIRELTDVATRMAGGDLAARVTTQSGDEVGQLGNAFNQMADAIKRREKDLRELAAGLESAVKQRTEQLEKQNEALTDANRQLDRARKEAEEATRLKSQFLAAMSHELRTPLNAIMGFSQLLQAQTSGKLTEKQLEQVNRIYKNGETLLDLINDLLDLAKIEAGRVELMHTRFIVRDWLNEIASQLESLATEKGLKFIVDYDPEMAGTITGDPVRLRQVAVNLISNAIKFTEKGEVRVHVFKADDKMWSLVVSDTGIGIPPHEQETIFDEFRQVDGSPQRKYGGTGLGLAIVRNLVLMMGGKIRVSSEVGKGSTFTVTLPLGAEESVKAETTA